MLSDPVMNASVNDRHLKGNKEIYGGGNIKTAIVDLWPPPQNANNLTVLAKIF